MSDWSRRGMLMYGMPPAPEPITPDLPDGWHPVPGVAPVPMPPFTVPGPVLPAPSPPTVADHRAKWIAEAEAAHRELADVCADDRVSEVPWPLVRRVELALHRLLLLTREASATKGDDK